MDRSELMARVRQKDTKPEVAIRKALWAEGFRYRLHEKVNGIRPDLVFRRARAVVFVDGCFWHGCPIHYVRPRTREEYWAPKLAANVERDRRQTVLLEEKGWRVLRFWEHEAKTDLDAVIEATRHAVEAENWVPPDDWRVFRVDDLPAIAGQEMQERHMCRLRDPSVTVSEIGPRVSGRRRVLSAFKSPR